MTGDRDIGSCSVGFPASSENRMRAPSTGFVISANKLPVLRFFGIEIVSDRIGAGVLEIEGVEVDSPSVPEPKVSI